MTAPLVLGTAGHIDHGKTALVHALTGHDTDRLPEEKARGISIDLGYAPLELPGGRRLSVVDVPGHEKFVRTMVAGATGIDLFLLVLDAAEGARPQTHEHLAILRLLGIDRGVVAITKADAVDPETLELALEEARELVPGVPVVATSARTGQGLDELRAALGEVASDVEPEAARVHDHLPTRLFVDRSFSLRGIGTVVTGTLWSGSIGEGDELVVEPGAMAVRVRSVQVHDRDVERAGAGQRVAVALPGIERRAVRRGDVLAEPGAYAPSYRLDVVLDELGTIRDHARLHVHHGTAEHLARVVRVGEHYAQLRLASPAVAARGDHVVLRDATTVGGGVVLDPAPPRSASAARLELLERGDPASIVLGVLAAAPEPLSRRDLERRSLLARPELETGLAAAARLGDHYAAPAWLDALQHRVGAELAERARANPLDPGVPLAELVPQRPWTAAVLAELPLERRGPKAYAPGASPALGDRAGAARRLEDELAASGFNPIRVDDRSLAAFLEEHGALVRVGDGLVLSAASYAEAKRRLVEECERSGSITLATFRDALGVGRRAAQLLLERFDAEGLTRRVGDERVLRRRRAER
jgi:selenocysteine-specific elongation factor